MNAILIIFTLWVPKKYYGFLKDVESVAVSGYFFRVFMPASTPVIFHQQNFELVSLFIR